MNTIAVLIFSGFIVFTLCITYWSARRTNSVSSFYTADGKITGFQNGLAIAGDWMSAATFLGLGGLVLTYGFDGMVYAVGATVSWPIVTFLVADRFRNLGKYTLTDVLTIRLKNRSIRILMPAII